MEDARDLARKVVNLIATLPRKPTAPDDPVLDEASAIIARGMRIRGFPAEFFRQCQAAGMELDPGVMAVGVIAGARASSRR